LEEKTPLYAQVVGGRLSVPDQDATADMYERAIDLLGAAGAGRRSDVGEGDSAPETRGRHFFPYKPAHLAATPPRPVLAKVTNDVQAILSSGKYLGAIWTQGSPQVEESAYWFSLLIDTTLPICGNAAQRPHGQASNDGPKNILDSVDYTTSRVWADEQGRNRAGAVVIQEQQIFAAREVAKVDARPGGYVATGGHGGILGGVGGHNPPMLLYLPATRHTYKSDVNVTPLPLSVGAVQATAKGIETITVAIKGADGTLLADAIPSVSIVKDGGYTAEDFSNDPSREVDLIALIKHKLSLGRLAGFIIEGLVPYGTM